MRVLVEINHYPGLLERKFDLAYMKSLDLLDEDIVGRPGFGIGIRRTAFRVGLNYFMIRALAERYLDYDAVICTNLPTIIAARMARKMGFSGKVVFDDYGVWPWKGFLPWGPMGALFPSWVRAVISSCREAIDAVITPSEFQRRNTIKRYGFNPEITMRIPYTIEDYFSPRVSGKKFRKWVRASTSEFLIAYAGRLNPVKGLDRLVLAFSTIEKELPSRLLIAGRDQGVLRKIKRLAKRLGVLHKITYIGMLAREKMPEFYAASDILVIPSLYETFCFVALEAMACGTPVVASNVGSLPEVVGDAGILCKPEPDEIANAVMDLCRNRELLSELRNRGFSRVKELRRESEKIFRVLEA